MFRRHRILMEGTKLRFVFDPIYLIVEADYD